MLDARCLERSVCCRNRAPSTEHPPSNSPRRNGQRGEGGDDRPGLAGGVLEHALQSHEVNAWLIGACGQSSQAAAGGGFLRDVDGAELLNAAPRIENPQARESDQCVIRGEIELNRYTCRSPHGGGSGG